MYSCALLRDILLQGRLYISRNWLCFYANLFGKDIKVGTSDGQISGIYRLRDGKESWEESGALTVGGAAPLTPLGFSL